MIRWPFILREDHDKEMVAIHRDVADLNTIVRKLESRLLDIERQFVVEWGDDGRVMKTLADVPESDRVNIKIVKRPNNPLRGANWDQRRRYLEALDAQGHK